MSITAKLVSTKPNRLYRMIDRMRNDDSALKTATEYVREGVVPPRDTGELEASIAVEKIGPGRYAIIAGAPHAVFVEYGTTSRAPNPFLRRAFAERKKEAIRRYIKALKRHR